MSIIFGQKGFHAAATPQCQEAIHGTGNSFFMIDAMLPIQVQAEYQDRLTQGIETGCHVDVKGKV
jgi:hypothetical protein